MFAEPSMPERRPSPGLALNLSSNNPFRNRAASPGAPSPNNINNNSNHPNAADRSSSGSRPMSRNPFLSTFEKEFNKEASRDLVDMSATMKDSPKKATFGTAAEELFNNLTIDNGEKRRAPPRPAPARSGTDPRAGHRPSRSEEERERMRGVPRGPPRPRGQPSSRPPHPSSPERRENRRPRRNSESSIIDKGSLEDERRRRERRREREARGKDGKSSSRRTRKPQGLDLIDKLDVTGIYGPSMIHHDGPYDAVQPHRNRKKDQRAPMEAFPAGSANNSLGGSGPLNSKIDLDRIHGRGAEGFTDFGGVENEWKKPSVPQIEFSAKDREDVLHGEQTHGLGTSTFLDGAPASRKAIEQDYEAHRAKQLADNGLGRKKSIAQRFRGISQPRNPRFGDGAPRITSPNPRYGATSPDGPNGPYSAGALSQSKATERNPFFSDEHDKAFEAKGATIKANEAEAEGSSSPGRNGLTRAITTESIGSPTAEGKPSGGFLNRVKSLKGGRRRPA
ncbi:Pal1-domain-containing protein [Plenodomus tracheiphilus IPT5]|uniref:Pal1-domain-containing protein n=1 Tax=Plenodomus tracheiphilus IPT5 TaxID=1408161 RepID=A0A6A7B793_9PLEO|nr:Pal1-domain-containing protein [Plenodomus tracheiphilus IPT5]